MVGQRWGREARAVDLLFGELAPILDVCDTETLGGLRVRHGGCEQLAVKGKCEMVSCGRWNGGGGALILCRRAACITRIRYLQEAYGWSFNSFSRVRIIDSCEVETLLCHLQSPRHMVPTALTHKLLEDSLVRPIRLASYWWSSSRCRGFSKKSSQPMCNDVILPPITVAARSGTRPRA